jgi:hypothetical protein
LTISNSSEFYSRLIGQILLPVTSFFAIFQRITGSKKILKGTGRDFGGVTDSLTDDFNTLPDMMNE